MWTVRGRGGGEALGSAYTGRGAEPRGIGTRKLYGKWGVVGAWITRYQGARGWLYGKGGGGIVLSNIRAGVSCTWGGCWEGLFLIFYFFTCRALWFRWKKVFQSCHEKVSSGNLNLELIPCVLIHSTALRSSLYESQARWGKSTRLGCIRI